RPMTLRGTKKWLTATLVASLAVALLPATGRCDDERVLLFLIEMAKPQKPQPPQPCAAPTCPFGYCRGAAAAPCCPQGSHEGVALKRCDTLSGCCEAACMRDATCPRCTGCGACRVSKPERSERACCEVNRDGCAACAAAVEQQAEHMRRLCAAQEKTLR